MGDRERGVLGERGSGETQRKRRVLERRGGVTQREKERSVRGGGGWGEREREKKRRVLEETEREITCRSRRLLQTFSAPDQECPVPSVTGFKQISLLL